MNSIYLPQHLKDSTLQDLLQEAESLSENPAQEIPKLMSAIMDIVANARKGSIEHIEIAKALKSYIHYLGLEKLKRMGIVLEYELPSVQDIFNENKNIEVKLAQQMEVL
ncbi:hypothetical protein CCZ01_03815 [Helicobacter monodelphidis]|uniref:hypothetical protein n=1 Tax=Helicobacter sp. 15-1451 TaxID=2004995 RepID=UPI000DCCB1EC|nr:hypothetical protein [Helicobacter sp. 15-1451]RAX58210.1 hypothetical protein CCZ01_03815 [Helicobacter sp. 15-1451]